jgi:alpha-D-xyloside xylohydrolase
LPSERAALKATDPTIDLAMETYLPAGSEWFDFWTNERFGGGRRVSREAPLDILPLYVRAGSIVPMGPIVQYATEALDAPYEIRIYPGADARFTIYEDDNETYAYERGQRATYDLIWNDQARTLRVGPRRGSFPGMVRERRLNLALMEAGNATGAAPATVTKEVGYSGKAITVSFAS